MSMDLKSLVKVGLRVLKASFPRIAVAWMIAVPAWAQPSPISLDECAKRVRSEVRSRAAAGLDTVRVEVLFQKLLIQRCLSEPHEAPSDARALFLGTINREYARLAFLFIGGQLDSSAYLGIVRDREAKRRLAREAGYVEEFAAGDEDGDLVPDTRDKCPNTPPNIVTDKYGCPDPRSARPRAPDDREVRRLIARWMIPFDKRCAQTAVPAVPAPLKLGYNNVDRKTFKLAITPVPRAPAGCPIYYEFGVAMHTVQFGLTVEEHAGLVFADTDNIEPLAARAVFVIPENATGPREVVFEKFKYSLGGAHWRVRAVNGAGVAGAWSPYAFATAPSFGEP